MVQNEKAAAKLQQESTSVNLLQWFWRKSWDKKVPVLALLMAFFAFLSYWFWNLTPVVVRMLTPKPEVHIGAAFYVYERGWTVEGKTMSTLSELRNLPSNCSLWAVPKRPLPKSVKIAELQSWVQTKFRFENISDERITNLRMSIASPLQTNATVVSHTPNVEAKGKFDTTHNDTRSTYVITIDAIPSRDVAILSLETPLNDNLRHFLYDEHGKVSVPIVSFSADQLSKLTPQVDRINASTMYQKETEMRTADKGISMAEKIEIRILGPSEPEPKDESDKLLPKATTCPPGTGGNW